MSTATKAITRDDVAAKVMALVRQVTGEMGEPWLIAPDAIGPQHNLADDIGLDLLDAMFIILEIEEEFDVCVPDDFDPLKLTVGEVTDRVVGLLARNNAG